MLAPTAAVAELITAIEPWDDREKAHIAQTLIWLASTDDIHRRIPPATPSPHLVVYTVLVDPGAESIFLGRHLKSGLDLPMGGHVDPGEHPLTAARREAREELNLTADFDVVGAAPFFLTVTPVLLPAPHTDITLWHVIRGDRATPYPLDPAEFSSGRWHPFTPVPDSDPHLPRFLAKLTHALTNRSRA
ncbi:NUDIX domain-containing protein [Nocardia sp. NPDC005978]|uniref:NUDIX domain-containing protein n=1 Tax=Nocardia sp. NPDC005978 TaxID=3156725 RepID=UPI00339E9058